MGAAPITQVDIPLRTSGVLGVLALALSWVTLAVEGVVAATHLIGSSRMYAIRHTVLIVFIAGTYFLLPVIGFAFVLSILGFAETRESDRVRRLVYLVLFAFVHLTLIPWQGFLRTFL
jgi:hypothetical protein